MAGAVVLMRLTVMARPCPVMAGVKNRYPFHLVNQSSTKCPIAGLDWHGQSHVRVEETASHVRGTAGLATVVCTDCFSGACRARIDPLAGGVLGESSRSGFPVRRALAAYHSHRRRRGQSRPDRAVIDRKSTRLNSSHLVISYAVFCLK